MSDADLGRERLIAAALSAQKNAYAPYANFCVGASLLTVGGDLFVGCNVENASYGLTICAERAVASAAIAGGSKEFATLAIASPGAAPPCGACRQYLSEFNSPLAILLIDVDCPDAIVETTLDVLFPQPFRAGG